MSTYDLVFKIDDCAIVAAEKVEPFYPAPRCAAPGCGDKIKNAPVWRLKLSSVPTSYVHVHDGCFDEDYLGVVNWVGM